MPKPEQLLSTEYRIMLLLESRLRKGRLNYGAFGDLTDDPRDFQQEALEEILDSLIYCAAKLLQLGKKYG